MNELFELEWLGGAPEKHFRKLTQRIDCYPWETLRPENYPPELVERARISWTEAAYNEYLTGAVFCNLLQALLQARAPLDLIGMASGFITDEIFHVELTSRIAMQLGGGSPHQIDFSELRYTPGGVTPLQQANEIVVRVCCVGEAFSVPMLAGCAKSAAHPLTHAVLKTIVADEGPHAQLGWYYLDWVSEQLDDAERARLATLALDALKELWPYWGRIRSTTVNGRTSEGYLLSDVRELGWMESQDYKATAKNAVMKDIVAPLARYGIQLNTEQVELLLNS